MNFKITGFYSWGMGVLEMSKTEAILALNDSRCNLGARFVYSCQQLYLNMVSGEKKVSSFGGC